MVNLKTSIEQKQTFKMSMGMWLPLLHCSLDEMDALIQEIGVENPYVEVEETYASRINRVSTPQYFTQMNANTDEIEALSTGSISFYEHMMDQIEPPLFPTPLSQNIAKEIISYLDDDGYFEGEMGSIASVCGTSIERCEKVRQRFAKLEPCGAGALDMKESFLFQLEECETDDELYALMIKLITRFEKMDAYVSHPRFNEAKQLFKNFKTPPALEFQEPSPSLVPDVIISLDENDISVQVNGKYYPEVKVSGAVRGGKFSRAKLKEARELVNLVALRKTTLYKIALVLIERQANFFYGGELEPLTMQEVADELGFNESTISRAVANKYLLCDRGIFEFKDFFVNELAPMISSEHVKHFIEQVIAYESKETPLSDQLILDHVQGRFHIQMVRRSITKYRQELNIASSNERRRLYKIMSA